VPGDPYPDDPGDGLAWYGTEDLWTVLPVDGAYRPRKSLWWSRGFPGSPFQEGPEISVEWRRLGGERTVVERNGGRGTNAYTPEHGWFMIAGLDPGARAGFYDDPGCWQVTATYGEATLTYVYAVPGESDPVAVDADHLDYHLRFRSGFDFLSLDLDHIAAVVADGGHPDAVANLGLELSDAEWGEFRRRQAVLAQAVAVMRLVTGRAFDEREEDVEGQSLVSGRGRLPTGPVFAGVWMDHMDGGLLKLAVTDAGAVDLDALYALFPRGADDLVIIVQEYSLDQLEAWRDLIGRRFQDLRIGGSLGLHRSDLGVRLRLGLDPALRGHEDALLAGIPRGQVTVDYSGYTSEGRFLPGSPLDS
jgi:hypothetical protein